MPDKTLRPTIVALTASGTWIFLHNFVNWLIHFSMIATIDERNRCFEHGCDGFLAKPLLIPGMFPSLAI